MSFVAILFHCSKDLTQVYKLTFGCKTISKVQLHVVQLYAKLKSIPLDGTLYRQFLGLENGLTASSS